MNIKFYKSIVFSSAFLVPLCGCGVKSDSVSEHTNVVSSSSEHIVTSLETTICPVSTSIISLTYPVTTTLVSASTSLSSSSSVSICYTDSYSDIEDYCITTCTITDNDSKVLDFVEKMGDSVRESFDSEELLDKGKSYFIYCVDFLFYDGEIGGIKFDDLTDSAKEQLLLDISTIDSLICSKYPNYKDDIKEGYGTAYNKASEVIKEGSTNVKDFSKEKLGEENYNKMKEYKDLFIDTAFGDWDDFVNILGKGKQKIKDWYEGLK